jgi:plastocyanin
MTILVLSSISFINVPQSEAATHEVHMSGFQFSPTPITIALGDTVEWTNDDAAIHEVTIQGAPGGTSPDLSQGEKWSYTFNTAGMFDQGDSHGSLGCSTSCNTDALLLPLGRVPSTSGNESIWR